MRDWIERQRQQPLRVVWQTVNAKLRGHYGYYAVSDNWPRLEAFRTAVMWILYQQLNRRSQRRSFTWEAWVAHVERAGLAKPQRVVANLNAIGP